MRIKAQKLKQRHLFFALYFLTSVFVVDLNSVIASPASVDFLASSQVPVVQDDQNLANEIVSYRAIYRMKLSKGVEQSDLVTANGVMSYSFQDQCDGWSSETSVLLNLGYQDGRSTLMNWTYADWETKNGLKYHFKGVQKQDDKIVEVIDGLVKRSSINKSTFVQFNNAKDQTVLLPAGTLFPTRFILDVFAASRKGENVYSNVVFDGAGLQNPYEVNAFFVPTKFLSKRPKLSNTVTPVELTKVKYPVQLAYFPKNSFSALPEYELTIDFQSNGIARYMRQDFGDFALDLTPDQVELLSSTDC